MISKIIFSAFLLSCCFIQIESAKEGKKGGNNNCFCRNTSIDSFEEFLDTKDGIVDYLWTVSLNDWSPLANQLKGELQVLRQSDSEQVVGYADLVILFMSTFNPYIERNPSGCAQASVINATISCIVDGDNTAISNEVNNNIIDSFYGVAINYAYCSGLEALGCPKSKQDRELCATSDPTWKCEENGFVYDIDRIWDLKGQNISPTTRDLVKELYQSDDFRDKYIALMATYSLLDLPNRVRLEFNPLTFFELLWLQFGPNYPQCCCSERINRLRFLRDNITRERKAAFQKLGDFYASPEACKNGNF